MNNTLMYLSNFFSFAGLFFYLNSELLCACKGALHFSKPALRDRTSYWFFLFHIILSSFNAPSSELVLDDCSDSSVEHLIAIDVVIAVKEIFLHTFIQIDQKAPLFWCALSLLSFFSASSVEACLLATFNSPTTSSPFWITPPRSAILSSPTPVF